MKLNLAALVGSLALSIASPVHAVPVVTLDPVSTSLLVGETTRVDVRVSGLDDELVGAYDFAIAWDGLLLSGSGVQFDTFLDGPADSIQLGGPFGVGNVAVAEVSLSTLVNQTGAGGFRLFSFDLTALAAGISALAFDAGLPLVLTAGDGTEFANVEYVGSRIAVADRPVAVPEPSTGALAALALLAIALRARRPVESR